MKKNKIIISSLITVVMISILFQINKIDMEYVIITSIIKATLFFVITVIYTSIMYIYLTNFIAKLILNKRLEKSEYELKEMKNIRIIKYKRINEIVNSIVFDSNGVPIENWNVKFNIVESIINFEILEIEHYKNNLSKVEITCRKMGEVNDNELRDEI